MHLSSTCNRLLNMWIRLHWQSIWLTDISNVLESTFLILSVFELKAPSLIRHRTLETRSRGSVSDVQCHVYDTLLIEATSRVEPVSLNWNFTRAFPCKYLHEQSRVIFRFLGTSLGHFRVTIFFTRKRSSDVPIAVSLAWNATSVALAMSFARSTDSKVVRPKRAFQCYFWCVIQRTSI